MDLFSFFLLYLVLIELILDLPIIVPHLVGFLWLGLNGSVEHLALALGLSCVDDAQIAEILVSLPLLLVWRLAEQTCAVEV